MQVPCSAISTINEPEEAATPAPLPPTIHLTQFLPPGSATRDPLVTIYGGIDALSLQPCTSAQAPANASSEQLSALTMDFCAAYAVNASGAPTAPVTAALAASYCDSAACVACATDSFAAGLCLPGVYVFAYTAPAGPYAWGNGTAAPPSVVLLAVAVAEVGGFSVQIDFPAESAEAAAALAEALAGDAALLAAVTADVQAQALASLNATAAGNGTGGVLDVTAAAPRVLPPAPSGDAGAYIVSLEVGVEFRYVPGLQSYRSAWPQGATNATGAPSAPSSGRRLLMHSSSVPRRSLALQRRSGGKSAAGRAPWARAMRGAGRLTAAGPGSLVLGGWGRPSRALLALPGRSLQQTTLLGLQSLLVGVPPSAPG